MSRAPNFANTKTTVKIFTKSSKICEFEMWYALPSAVKYPLKTAENPINKRLYVSIFMLSVHRASFKKCVQISSAKRLITIKTAKNVQKTYISAHDVT